MLTKSKRKRSKEISIMQLNGRKINDYAKSRKLHVCVIGLGRVGLPTAISFAKKGINCMGVDIDPVLVESLNKGKTKFDDEPELGKSLKEVVRRGTFKATTNIQNAVSSSNLIILCLPTPVDFNSLTTDYSAIISACTEVGKAIQKGSLITVESTVCPSVVEDLIIPTIEKNSTLKVGEDFGIASCPERVNPSNILDDLKKVTRVIGGYDENSVRAALALYKYVYGVKIVKVKDCRTANAVKLTENVFRYINIAYVNELAFLYEKLGIDIKEVIDACKTKYNFVAHYPSSGVGGPCLPANLYQLLHTAAINKEELNLPKVAREINENMPRKIVDIITEALKQLGKSLLGSTVTILGVTYKPNVSDIRQSPVEVIVRQLVQSGVKVKIYDPIVKSQKIFSLPLEKNYIDAMNGSDTIVVATGHRQFKEIDFGKVIKNANRPIVVVDIANILTNHVKNLDGIIYRGIGKKSIS